jgi:hypothetical protein
MQDTVRVPVAWGLHATRVTVLFWPFCSAEEWWDKSYYPRSKIKPKVSSYIYEV